jgi:hypothetical protein
VGLCGICTCRRLDLDACKVFNVPAFACRPYVFAASLQWDHYSILHDWWHKIDTWLQPMLVLRRDAEGGAAGLQGAPRDRVRGNLTESLLPSMHVIHTDSEHALGEHPGSVFIALIAQRSMLHLCSAHTVRAPAYLMLHVLDSPLRMHLERCYIWYFLPARHILPRLVLPCAHSFSDLALQDGTAEVVDQELVTWQTGRFGGEEAYIAAGEPDEIDVALHDRSRGVR